MPKINIKVLLVTLSLILSLTLAAGCTFVTGVETTPQQNATTNPTPPAGQLTPVSKNEAPLPSISTNQAPALPSIADVVAKVKPSVVAINTSVPGYDPYTGSST
ncbi:MAG: hypothetical protein Q7K41_02055, partial [Dehalococcoidales bacterium]|nr:hypothetical protein [Dehalococcoidales bacterium]